MYTGDVGTILIDYWECRQSKGQSTELKIQNMTWIKLVHSFELMSSAVYFLINYDDTEEYLDITNQEPLDSTDK